MQSIGPECNELKKTYEACFNQWFSEKFLKGVKEDSCAPIFKGKMGNVVSCFRPLYNDDFLAFFFVSSKKYFFLIIFITMSLFPCSPSTPIFSVSRMREKGFERKRHGAA